MPWMSYLSMGLLSGIQAQQQNNMNLENRTWSANQAQLNRNFQQQMQTQAMNYNTQMSDTAVQRRMQDNAAAGVNPLLGISSGGAVAPMMGAPSGSMANTPQTQTPGQVGLSGANQTAQTAAQIKNLVANTENTQTETALKQSQLPYSAANADATLQQLLQTNKNLEQQGQNLMRDWSLKDAQAVGQEQDNAFQRALWDLRVQKQQADTEMAKYGIARARVESDWFSSPEGRAMFPLNLPNGTEQMGGSLGINAAKDVGTWKGIPETSQEHQFINKATTDQLIGAFYGDPIEK